MLVTARLRPPDRVVEVADVRRVADLLARLEVLPGAVLGIRERGLLTSRGGARATGRRPADQPGGAPRRRQGRGPLRHLRGDVTMAMRCKRCRGAAVMEGRRDNAAFGRGR